MACHSKALGRGHRQLPFSRRLRGVGGATQLARRVRREAPSYRGLSSRVRATRALSLQRGLLVGFSHVSSLKAGACLDSTLLERSLLLWSVSPTCLGPTNAGNAGSFTRHRRVNSAIVRGSRRATFNHRVCRRY